MKPSRLWIWVVALLIIVAIFSVAGFWIAKGDRDILSLFSTQTNNKKTNTLEKCERGFVSGETEFCFADESEYLDLQIGKQEDFTNAISKLDLPAETLPQRITLTLTDTPQKNYQLKYENSQIEPSFSLGGKQTEDGNYSIAINFSQQTANQLEEADISRQSLSFFLGWIYQRTYTEHDIVEAATQVSTLMGSETNLSELIYISRQE